MKIQGRRTVTGGGSGLRRGHGARTARLGARVAVLDVNLDNARRVADDIGGPALQCDVTSADSVQADRGRGGRARPGSHP